MKRSTFFVTGTDTDVGKTCVATGLLHAARARGLSTLGLKPLAAGCEPGPEGLRNSDALALWAQSTLSISYEQVNPIALEPAIAPHLAAQEAGKSLSADRLAGYCRGALGQADFTLVEGAGGWRVPLNASESLADLPRLLKLPVILVVGLRLGCLNHALLSAEAIVRDGLPLVAWVANTRDPQMPYLEQNVQSLAQRLGAPCLGVLPVLSDPTPEQASPCLNLDLLL